MPKSFARDIDKIALLLRLQFQSNKVRTMAAVAVLICVVFLLVGSRRGSDSDVAWSDESNDVRHGYPRIRFLRSNRRSTINGAFGPDVHLSSHQMYVADKANLATFLHNFDEHRKLFFVLLSHESPDFKQLCAIESASRVNPDFVIILINIVDERVSSGFFKSKREAKRGAPLYTTLNVTHRPNVVIVHTDLDVLLAETPFKDLLTYRSADAGYFAPGMADGIRLQLVHDFGGVYTDLDMIHKESLNGFRNVLAGESADDAKDADFKICNAHVIFDKGHPFLGLLIEKFFDIGKQSGAWGNTGPYLFTTVWNETCVHDNDKRCDGVEVLSQRVFNPVLSNKGSSWLESWQDHSWAQTFHRQIYNPGEDEPVATTLHMWNTLITYWVGKDPNPINGTHSLLGYSMNEHCPTVFGHTQNTKNHDPTW